MAQHIELRCMTLARLIIIMISCFVSPPGIVCYLSYQNGHYRRDCCLIFGTRRFGCYLYSCVPLNDKFRETYFD